MNDQAERRKAILFPKQQKVLRTLGENIKLARKRRQLTQKLISERTGISPITLRKIEQGDAGVSIGHYLSVLAVLNLAEDLAKVAQDDEFGRRLQDAKLLGMQNKGNT
ncbi:MAG: helix-turn-helix domain-containing protein [Gammaproteobacteria bacterium]|nr:helix-turn-helix domain-containing protein [Gammaproteobacteria bacterium]MBU1723034.1 helix-turn-helix domain-containing protein [Gammaproteobacteria bacterium]MBU2003835.1 helix-turn-helix domain-containing protein [Gammaproteobacteria bacterium]